MTEIQNNLFGIKWPTGVDMPLNKTQTQIQIEREREGVYKIGYKEKQSQSYLSYLDGFLWRIFLLLRAPLLPGVLGFSSVRHEPCPTTNFLFSFFCWREEGATSILGSQPIV